MVGVVPLIELGLSFAAATVSRLGSSQTRTPKSVGFFTAGVPKGLTTTGFPRSADSTEATALFHDMCH